jgi:hypothetical protein
LIAQRAGIGEVGRFRFQALAQRAVAPTQATMTPSTVGAVHRRSSRQRGCSRGNFVQRDGEPGCQRAGQTLGPGVDRIRSGELSNQLKERIYLPQNFLPCFRRKQSGGPPGFLKEQPGFIYLSLGNHFPVHDANPVFLGGQLGSCCQAPNHRGLILNRIGFLKRAKC